MKNDNRIEPNQLAKSVLLIEQNYPPMTLEDHWFADQGSLTQKLSNMGQFTLTCYREMEISLPESYWYREVVEYLDQVPIVWGLTLVPTETLKANPWIRQLGCRPIGKKLFKNTEWRRSPSKNYSLSPASELLIHASELGIVEIKPYLRSSTFVSASGNLQIFELFSKKLS
ncbi:MAG: hypothetical protein A3F17_03245 [Gammaproteobacteria bacterium RIFCSPHIGHO2_12_FULL_41_15]|nr:MAG: hypothetical protein A3F17_03245 [Gammaproteobacteria bacterium RIFCSPHIGHO2_12_FULL_41_15]